MSMLEQVTSGRVQRPHRVVLYGTPGIGKSTWASKAPKPIFMGTEDGTSHLDVFRFPVITEWKQVTQALSDLRADHDFQTLVVDTLDWLEPLAVRDVCTKNNVTALSDLGYGKGFAALVDLWRLFLKGCEQLSARGMHVILLAHSQIKQFKDPERDPYDRYELKISPRAASLVTEWASDVLFANYEVVGSRDKQTQHHRGISTGARVVHTVYSAAFDAKNRHGLPETMPLDWDAFHAACEAASASPEKLFEQIEQACALLSPERAEKAISAAQGSMDNVARLRKILARVKQEAGEL